MGNIVAQTLKSLNKKIILCILDGFGINSKDLHNAVLHAHKPTFDDFMSHFPNTLIEPGGEAVGLPKGVAGNSEVGHINLGAGRPVRQDLVRIDEAIASNTLAQMPELKNLITTARQNTKRIHLFGLLSDGCVHSHIRHFKEIIKILSQEKDLSIFFHAFMDGRDTASDCGEKYIHDLLSVPGFTFASIQGRSIGMDRDRRWEKIKLCYDTWTGQGAIENIAPHLYLQGQYQKKIYDEFITPVLFHPDYAMGTGDALFSMNFRPDRAIELALAFNWKQFKEFTITVRPSFYLCMTPYIPDEEKLPILFDKENVPGTLSQYLSELGQKQFKIAETEKYAHVTYFFNGGKKNTYPGEEHVLIPSPREIQTYDQKPEMSAFLVTDRIVQAIETSQYNFILVNYANADMVGHTGNYPAAIKAVESVDLCLKRLKEAADKSGYTILLTADHGNADQMVYEDGRPHTSHTNSQVPFIVIDERLRDKKLVVKTAPALMDVAPTILNAMGLDCPANFVGKSIFE
ncbi:MAG: phosphoglycerate mutase (2,3-diphosphoglycerate-independent) [Bdellovibrionales bacterium GWA2_49_15]|nr:MAG: phosphoglycerate mutase (2,3-diphosphoglycerate-independent) [Bdellovibrionales bacterium GWA2_49_15]HAZ13999.1 2,3-bisphosphoglycerate-independent phosphoglycerate mutase [Bdellovibrionales bacterium]